MGNDLLNTGKTALYGAGLVADGFNNTVTYPFLEGVAMVGDYMLPLEPYLTSLDQVGYVGKEFHAGVFYLGAGLRSSRSLRGLIGGKRSIEFIKNTRIEVKVLQRQGYSLSEAFQQIRRFNAGNADGFFFHFTNQVGGLGILKSSVINASRTGLRGSGVYAGTTPIPSWFLKNSFAPGWGISGRNVRIPFKTNQQSKPFVYTFKTKVFPKSVDL